MSDKKRARQSESENESESESEREGNEDRLSVLPDCLLHHILSFVTAKYAVRTCILSKRWMHLWKRFPILTFHSPDHRTLEKFTKFVLTLLSLRDHSVALHTLKFERRGSVEPHLLESVLSYAISHNVQRLDFYAHCIIGQLPPCISSGHTLTSLKLSVIYATHTVSGTLFPKSLNLPALTSLHLHHFAFCASDNDQAEPFSACKRLNNLVLDNCNVRDAQILCISSATLTSLTICSKSSYIYEIVLSAPNLRSFAFMGIPYQQISGSCLSSLEQVNIDAEIWNHFVNLESPFILISWMIELANVQSLTVTASTLQVLYLIRCLMKMKLPCFLSLKSLKVILKPLSDTFARSLGVAKPWKAKNKPSLLIPDGIVDFLLQNSPSEEVSLIKC